MTDKRQPQADPSAAAKRHRTRQLAVRCTPEELAAIQEKAAASGLATGAFARAAMLGGSGPRARRRTTADKEALLRVLAQLGRVGNNINQIARRLNTGDTIHLPSLEQALGAYLDIRNAIFEALGLAPTEAPKGPATPARRPAHDHQGRKPGGP
jgi:hypothetical protein